MLGTTGVADRNTPHRGRRVAFGGAAVIIASVSALASGSGASALVLPPYRTAGLPAISHPASGPGQGGKPSDMSSSPLPSKAAQIRALKAALKSMHKNYADDERFLPNPSDVFDYGVGDLWRKGVDGAGTTVAVIEGWNYTGISAELREFDKVLDLPPADITTRYLSGNRHLPSSCPQGMVALGSYGSCRAWAGELTLDVLSVHLMAPYAKILIAVAPPNSQRVEDAASEVAPPEMMQAIEDIAAHHLANVISISDGTAETSYPNGAPEILAQDPGELAAAAAGIPLLVATGDTGVLQVLPSHNGSVLDTRPGTGTWDDSPWVTAVGGSMPNLGSDGARLGPDELWQTAPAGEQLYSAAAGYSEVFRRPSYESGVASITRSKWRNVPDITMDARSGTSQAAPLFAGVLALATQENAGNVGPINPVLYGVLGPKGAADGIADVTSGQDSTTYKGVTYPGFTAGKGYDVASGWGTVFAPNFVPSLVAATKSSHEEKTARSEAAGSLADLEHAVTISPSRVPQGNTPYLTATGFLPGAPVTLSIDGQLVATLHADRFGDVTTQLATTSLATGTHTVTLGSMLIPVTGIFHVT